jgi:hypothetical protein
MSVMLPAGMVEQGTAMALDLSGQFLQQMVSESNAV